MFDRPSTPPCASKDGTNSSNVLEVDARRIPTCEKMIDCRKGARKLHKLAHACMTL